VCTSKHAFESNSEGRAGIPGARWGYRIANLRAIHVRDVSEERGGQGREENRSRQQRGRIRSYGTATRAMRGRETGNGATRKTLASFNRTGRWKMAKRVSCGR